MQGVARLRLPRERLEQPFSCDRHRRRLVAPHPANRVLEQPAQVRIAGSPERALDVAGEIRHARAAALPQDDGRLVGVRGAWVDHLGREGGIGRHHGQNRPTGFAQADRNAVLGAGQERRAFEACQHRMAFLDPHVAVGGGADELARDGEAPQIGEGRLAARVAPFVAARGLEGSQQRATRLHVGADLPAGLVRQVGGVGDEQSAVAAQRLLRQVALVHEVEDKPPLQ